ncbi:MAG: hypothetical protein PVH64_10265 [Bacillota bacterium]|jgi:hypothetical protein
MKKLSVIGFALMMLIGISGLSMATPIGFVGIEKGIYYSQGKYETLDGNIEREFTIMGVYDLHRKFGLKLARTAGDYSRLKTIGCVYSFSDDLHVLWDRIDYRDEIYQRYRICGGFQSNQGWNLSGELSYTSLVEETQLKLQADRVIPNVAIASFGLVNIWADDSASTYAVIGAMTCVCPNVYFYCESLFPLEEEGEETGEIGICYRFNYTAK